MKLIAREKGFKEDSLVVGGNHKQVLNLQNSSESLESERKPSDITRHCSVNEMDNVARIQYSEKQKKSLH